MTQIKRGPGRPAADLPFGADQLLRAARASFARRGFDASSMRDISRDAGVDVALIAHHFGSKEALWVAVVKQIASQMAPVIEATAKLGSVGTSAGARVDAALRLLVDLVFKEPDVGMFFLTAATQEGRHFDTLVGYLVRPYHDVLLPLIVSSFDENGSENRDPEVTFMMLMSAVSATVSYSPVVQVFSSSPQNTANFKRYVLETARNIVGCR